MHIVHAVVEVYHALFRLWGKEFEGEDRPLRPLRFRQLVFDMHFEVPV